MKSEYSFFELVDGSTTQITKARIRKKKVKVVCTLGPSSNSKTTIKKLIENGMDVARLNFSHGSHKDHRELISRIREVAHELNRHIGILQDIQGPKIRVGKFEGGVATLKKGQKFILSTRPALGNQSRASISYRGLHKDIKAGDRILLDDGLLFLIVKKVAGTEIHTEVAVGGSLKNNKGVNLPDTKLNLSCLTAKDRRDLIFGAQHGVDFIALSFISDARDIRLTKNLLKRKAKLVPIVAKIETQHSVENIDEILEETDGIMVARGDLGVECPLEQVPGLQKRIIRAANRSGKFVITATQMLESMVWNPRPTRAEASDVANAVLDGTDAVMLSAETASGSHPVDAVKTMSRIIVRTEEYEASFSDIQEHRLQESSNTIAQAITAAAVQITNSLNTVAVVAFTQSGRTPKLVSRNRPKTPIFALCPFDFICRRLSIYWGVFPEKTKKMVHTDDMAKLSKPSLKKFGLWKKKNQVVMLSGTPVRKPGSTNLLKVFEIK